MIDLEDKNEWSVVWYTVAAVLVGFVGAIVMLCSGLHVVPR